MKDQDNLNEKFTKAYDDLADPIFRHCYFRISDREKAKDLTQETFIKAWDYIQKDQTGKIKNMKALIYKIANNLVIDEYRKRKGNLSLNHLSESGFDVQSNDQIDKRIEINMESQKILKVIDGLEETYKEVVLMRYIEELSPKEIAEIIGESPNNISVRINRAIKQIRENLNDEE